MTDNPERREFVPLTTYPEYSVGIASKNGPSM